MFLHMFLSGEPKGQSCLELSSVWGKRLVEVFNLDLFSYGANHNDLGEVLGDVLDRVCLNGGEREFGIDVPIDQADDQVADGDHQNVP